MRDTSLTVWDNVQHLTVAQCHEHLMRLDDELAIVKPRALVCLGSTAAQALLGRQFRVTAQRGTPVPSPLAPIVVATVHPSSILRASDEETRRAEYAEFVADLKVVARSATK